MTTYKTLSPDLQVGFHYRLKAIKDLYFHEALSLTIKKLQIADIDAQLKQYVRNESLQKLAEFSLRGEAIFPLPILLTTNPYLLGYYRLLFGFSQKEFYSKGPFGIFKGLEEKGKISSAAATNLEALCSSLIETATVVTEQINEFNIGVITELQLLTVGPQLRGSKNNEYGQLATQRTFTIIKDMFHQFIVESSPTAIKIKNNSGRIVAIKFSADPDIEITEQLPSGERGLISIEIKGGKDVSNIHNRIGEAEKSHQKARQRGYFEFMTIISVDFPYAFLRAESPTTSHFFHLDKISDKHNLEYVRFLELLSSIVSVTL